MTNSKLSHHGILGMKWGVRRYQNEDGTLTEAGKERYKTQLQADIASAAKKNDKSSARNVFTNKETSDIAVNVKTKTSDIDNAAKTLRNLGDTIAKKYDEIYKVSKAEALKAIKDPNFKKDLDKKLNDLFGDGCEDEEDFNWERDAAVIDLLNSFKYTPETANRVKQAKDEINEYYEICKQEAKRITDGYGSETVSEINKIAVKYEDVVTDMIHRAADSSWISYLYRNGEDYLFDDIDEINDSSIYSMTEYNKRHS